MYPRVNILLATYNGENFLSNLLDSLLSQTYSNLKIYVLDDGSTDDTLNILKTYQKRGIIIVPNSRNLGYPFSFFKLLEVCDNAEFYCFCDQDDIWLPQKVEWAVEKLSATDANKPNLYFAAFNYCDENMKIIKKSSEPPKNLFLSRCLFQCYLWGFTMSFNETARQKIVHNIPHRFKSKDYWMQILCTVFGTVVYDTRVCANYRRHNKNVSPVNLSFWKFQWWRFCHFWVEDSFSGYHGMLKEFYEFYADHLTKEQQKLLYLFQSDGYALKKAFYPHRLRSTLFDEIMLRVVFLLHKL